MFYQFVELLPPEVLVVGRGVSAQSFQFLGQKVWRGELIHMQVGMRRSGPVKRV
jgi:hypothetical protein